MSPPFQAPFPSNFELALTEAAFPVLLYLQARENGRKSTMV